MVSVRGADAAMRWSVSAARACCSVAASPRVSTADCRPSSRRFASASSSGCHRSAHAHSAICSPVLGFVPWNIIHFGQSFFCRVIWQVFLKPVYGHAVRRGSKIMLQIFTHTQASKYLTAKFGKPWLWPPPPPVLPVLPVPLAPVVLLLGALVLREMIEFPIAPEPAPPPI